MRGQSVRSAFGASPAHRRRRQSVGAAGSTCLLGLLCLAFAACSTTVSSPRASPHTATSRSPVHRQPAAPRRIGPRTPGVVWVTTLEQRAKGSPGYLQPGSDPSVLPGPVLVADRTGNQLLLVSPKGQVLWQFPGDGVLAPGQTFQIPDDAFFTPDGKGIVATQEDDDVITELSPATGRITYRYGQPGVPGTGPGELDHPDDAMALPDGAILSPDIKNCRIIVLRPGDPAPATVFGETTQACEHTPPARFGSPNGAFPLQDGNYLVTEINGDWVDEMTPTGQVLWSTHPPGFTYPSDTNEVGPGVYVSADYTDPGGLETFDSQGHLLWQYVPATPGGVLDQPSLALPLPNGDFVLNDDYNDRVVVIDPRTNRIVWQYGHTAVPGTAPGFLSRPDGVDLAPPYSLLMRHAATMGLPPAGP